jgi:MipA family protein
MNPRTALASLALSAAVVSTAALAGETEAEPTIEDATNVRGESGPQATATPASAPPVALTRPVFDETWATIGLGAAMAPSYAGSNDYVTVPLPLIVGRIGGVGISPNGSGLVFDVNSPKPMMSPPKGARVAFGPAVRFRDDRNSRISDDVVARAARLDAALEVGGNVAVSFFEVFMPFDQLTIGMQARWDVLGAHDGMIIEPEVSYRAFLGNGFTLQAKASAEVVDDSFADYYFSVSPAQANATSLARFQTKGGLNRIGTTAIISYDLDRNPLNGGWALIGIGGYSRLVGDSADTPYTSVRGDANQFLAGLGVAFTF